MEGLDPDPQSDMVTFGNCAFIGSLGICSSAVNSYLDLTHFFAVPLKESWLEIYKVPKDTWIKEMEAALTSFSSSGKPTMESAALVS